MGAPISALGSWPWVSSLAPLPAPDTCFSFSSPPACLSLGLPTVAPRL